MGILFGTDGIRGQTNTYPMTAGIAMAVGQALAMMFNEKGKGKIIIGKDTRQSGDMFEHALAAGACSMGTDVILAGVIPTAGVAYLSGSRPEVVAGVVISASHNPYQDNGIKVFNGQGFKLDNTTEARLEKLIVEAALSSSKKPQRTGNIKNDDQAAEAYRGFLKNIIPDLDLSGVKAVIDCSNGASSIIGTSLFKELGLDAVILSASPNGTNINRKCGSEHLDPLKAKVVETTSDLGLAFDGDADRLIAVDRKGRKVSGDQIIAICALDAHEKDALKNNTVVTTIMSNMGLGLCLKKKGITHVMSDVGDRYVMMDMVKTGAVVGGENSGHMIFMDHHTTGDGLISALKLLSVIKRSGRSLDDLASQMTVLPQVLENVIVSSKPDIESVPEIIKAINSSEKELEGKGRVLVRYSGTESKCRVMVEATEISAAEGHAKKIAAIVKKVLG